MTLIISLTLTLLADPCMVEKADVVLYKLLGEKYLVNYILQIQNCVSYKTPILSGCYHTYPGGTRHPGGMVALTF